MVSTIPTVMASFSSGTANQTSVTNETAASANKIRVNGLMNASASRERNPVLPVAGDLVFAVFAAHAAERILLQSPDGKLRQHRFRAVSCGAQQPFPDQFSPAFEFGGKNFLLHAQNLQFASVCKGGGAGDGNHFRRREECGQPEAPRPGGSTFRLLPSSIFSPLVGLRPLRFPAERHSGHKKTGRVRTAADA